MSMPSCRLYNAALTSMQRDDDTDVNATLYKGNVPAGYQQKQCTTWVKILSPYATANAHNGHCGSIVSSAESYPKTFKMVLAARVVLGAHR